MVVGFGTIYIARDTFSAIGGNYVVKHFSPSYENVNQLETAMRLFKQESDSLQKLGNHPQIPRIYDFFEEDHNFFLVQEFIEGETLKQELAQTDNFNQAKAIKLLTQTLEVLKFVHQSGYIHRDIKPANLIRNRFDQRIFLIDFGAVKEKINPQNINEQGSFSHTIGIVSPGYTSDEQFHGRPQYCSDLYALGMVTIQAMTGERPSSLQRNSNLELMWRDRLSPHLVYDLSFLNLIDKMVEQTWQERYQSANEILEDLESIVLTSGTAVFEPAPALILKSEAETKTETETSVAPQAQVITEVSKPQGRLNKFKLLAALGTFGAIAMLFLLYLNNLKSSNYITYENEHIRIDYPPKWSKENSTNFLNTTVVFTSPKENESDRFQERVAVVVEESPNPISLQQYSDRAVSQIENLDNFIVSPPRSTTLGRSDGKYVLYQGMDRNIKVKRQEVWTVNYRQIYTVIYTAEPQKFDKFAPQAQKMIESLEIVR